MTSPGVAFALAVDAVVLAVGAGIAAYWWVNRAAGRGESEDGDRVATWHAEAAALAAEVQRSVERTGAVADHDEVQRWSLPLSARVKGHARAAPAGVDDRLVGAVHALGVDCYRVGMEHTTRDALQTGTFLEDELDDLAATAATVEAAAAARTGDGGSPDDAGDR